MPIPFTCPHCGAQRMVADEYAGQSGTCASCHQPITIPANPQMLQDGTPLVPPAATTSSGGGKVALWVVLGVAVVLGACMVIGILTALLLPAVQMARDAARQMESSNQMKKVGLAMLNYEDEWNCFPAASFADPQTNKPPHSWRVAILKHIDPQLYEQYDFSKPWDDPANRRLESQMPDCFKNPRIDAPEYHTNYLAVVGPRAVLRENAFCRIGEISDGTSRTVMIIESNRTVHWMAPTDLSVDEAVEELLASEGEFLQPLLLFADGSVQELDELVNSLIPDSSLFNVNDDRRDPFD